MTISLILTAKRKYRQTCAIIVTLIYLMKYFNANFNLSHPILYEKTQFKNCLYHVIVGSLKRLYIIDSK